MKELVLILALLVAVAGCKPKETKSPGVYVGEVSYLMDELSGGDVFLVVNGQEFSKKDFAVAVSLADKMRRMCAGDAVKGHNKAAEEYALWSRPRTLSDMLRRALMRDYARKNGVKATEAEVEEYSKKIAASLKRAGSSIDAIAGELGPKEGRLFRQYVIDDATEPTLRRFVDAEGVLNISDDDVIAISNRIAKMQARAAMSNACEKAILEKALARINKGEDFAAVAKELSRDPEQGEFWETDYLDEMDTSPALMNWASTAKTGDVSGILELDDGWAVVKVVSRRPEDLPPGEIRIPKDVWELVRVSRNLYETPPDMDREEIVENLISFRSKKVQSKLGDIIMKEAVIEWPKGTNLFVRVASGEDAKRGKDN